MNLHDLQAPGGNGEVLAFPPLDEAATLLRGNRTRLARADSPFGMPLADLRILARREILQVAHHYSGLPGTSFDEMNRYLVVAGHQPELFHPGVWAKNFALAGLARSTGGTALNLIIDGDTAKNALLRYPQEGRLVSVPFDRWPGETPYEDWEVEDEEMFAQVPQRVEEASRAWPFRPLLPEYWREVRRQGQRTRNVGERFAGARRELERAWGCTNLEVPMSRVCGTEAFAWFAGWLLREARKIREVHNRAVAGYRLRHGLKSRNHPVPDLQERDGWTEVPLWGWRAGERRRRRIWSRSSGRESELRLGEEVAGRVPAEPGRTATALRDLQTRGLKFRTRALTTTLFARVILGDLFVHGLGGGKYDAVTDDLVRELFDCEPPVFLVVSATLRLPFPRREGLEGEVRRLQHTLRDLHFNPDRHLAPTTGKEPMVAELVRQRHRWREAPVGTSEERKRRFRELRETAARLRQHVAAEERRQEAALAETRREQHRQEVEGRRDFAFCLHPEERLRELMAGLQ